MSILSRMVRLARLTKPQPPNPPRRSTMVHDLTGTGSIVDMEYRLDFGWYSGEVWVVASDGLISGDYLVWEDPKGGFIVAEVTEAKPLFGTQDLFIARAVPRARQKVHSHALLLAEERVR